MSFLVSILFDDPAKLFLTRPIEPIEPVPGDRGHPRQFAPDVMVFRASDRGARFLFFEGLAGGRKDLSSFSRHDDVVEDWSALQR
jgi:hypothetical protein